MKIPSLMTFLTPAVLLIFALLPAQAATYYVEVDRATFFPATQTINVGDTVIWVNHDFNGDSHTSTSTLPTGDIDSWSGYMIDVDDEFPHTFNNPGTFTYFDLLDNGTGTIIVKAPVVTPIIHLVSPILSGGKFRFQATGLTVSKTNVLQVSTNLTSWTSVATSVATSGSLMFTNTIGPANRFFQVVELP